MTTATDWRQVEWESTPTEELLNLLTVCVHAAGRARAMAYSSDFYKLRAERESGWARMIRAELRRRAEL